MWIELLDTTTAAEVPVSKLMQPPAMEVSQRGKQKSRDLKQTSQHFMDCTVYKGIIRDYQHLSTIKVPTGSCRNYVSAAFLEVEVRLICWTVHDLQMRMCATLRVRETSHVDGLSCVMAWLTTNLNSLKKQHTLLMTVFCLQKRT